MKKSSLNLEAIQRYLISCRVFWPLGLSEKFIVKTSLHFLAGIDNQQVERWIQLIAEHHVKSCSCDLQTRYYLIEVFSLELVENISGYL